MTHRAVPSWRAFPARLLDWRSTRAGAGPRAIGGRGQATDLLQLRLPVRSVPEPDEPAGYRREQRDSEQRQEPLHWTGRRFTIERVAVSPGKRSPGPRQVHEQEHQGSDADEQRASSAQHAPQGHKKHDWIHHKGRSYAVIHPRDGRTYQAQDDHDQEHSTRRLPRSGLHVCVHRTPSGLTNRTSGRPIMWFPPSSRWQRRTHPPDCRTLPHCARGTRDHAAKRNRDRAESDTTKFA